MLEDITLTWTRVCHRLQVHYPLPVLHRDANGGPGGRASRWPVRHVGRATGSEGEGAGVEGLALCC